MCKHLCTPVFSLHFVLMLSFTVYVSKKLQTHIFNLPKLPDSGPADYDQDTGCDQG